MTCSQKLLVCVVCLHVSHKAENWVNIIFVDQQPTAIQIEENHADRQPMDMQIEETVARRWREFLFSFSSLLLDKQ